MQHSFTHIYCHNCNDIIPARIDDLARASVNGNYIGGDICCSECFLILATVYNPVSAEKDLFSAMGLDKPQFPKISKS